MQIFKQQLNQMIFDLATIFRFSYFHSVRTCASIKIFPSQTEAKRRVGGSYYVPRPTANLSYTEHSKITATHKARGRGKGAEARGQRHGGRVREIQPGHIRQKNANPSNLTVFVDNLSNSGTSEGSRRPAQSAHAHPPGRSLYRLRS